MAREQEVVVLPTPPFPPTKIHRRVFWETMDSKLGSRVSPSFWSMIIEDMVAVKLVGCEFRWYSNHAVQNPQTSELPNI